ncbi:hypothetical protein BFP97_07605 [Roseivirga sp. 4D4]|nr:hypothetical protein BFP97_07605 [Roseivirga sp. 4D4]
MLEIRRKNIRYLKKPDSLKTRVKKVLDRHIVEKVLKSVLALVDKKVPSDTSLLVEELILCVFVLKKKPQIRDLSKLKDSHNKSSQSIPNFGYLLPSFTK